MPPPASSTKSVGFFEKWWGLRVSLGISLGVSVIFLLLYYSVLLSERTSAAANVLRRFELSTVDTRFLLRQRFAKPSPDPRIVIVEIDQKAQEELGRWPFSRQYFAQMLDVLRGDGARVVGFDVTFSKPDEGAKPIRDLRQRLEAQQKEGGEAVDPRLVAELARVEAQYKVDDQFAEAIRGFGRVVLGNFFLMSEAEARTLDKATIENYAQIIGDFPFPQARTSSSAKGQQSYVRMIENYDELGMSPAAAEANLKVLSDALSGGHSGTGFFNVFPDADGVVRKGILALPFGLSPKKTEWDLYASLDVQVVRSYLDLSNDRIILSFGENGIENVEFGSSDVVQPDDVGRVNINYRGPARTFPYTSIADVVNHKFTPGTFKDKIVLVGASAVGVADLRTTPFSAFNYPGVEIHANIVDNILNQRFLERDTREFLIDVAFIFLFGLPLGLWLATAQPMYLPLTLFLWVPFGAFVQYSFDRGWLLNATLPALTLLTNTLAVALYRVLIEEKEKRKVRGTFQQYLSPEVIRRMLADPKSLAPRKQEITILFSDIRGFTSISEKLDAQELANLLNEYLTEMTRIIFRNLGTLDKYIGDAVMAFWGAPFEDSAQAGHAARAAFEMLQKLEELQRGWAPKGLPRLDIGVGINRGVASVGNMGSAGRIAYTALGDSVNLASRLEGLNKEYRTRVLLSEYAYKDARVPEFLYREVDIIRVKGKEQPVTIYELAGLRDQKDLQEKIEMYGRARAFYKRRDWRQASGLFTQLLRRWPEDGPAHILAQRCDEYLLEEPEPQWDGVYVMKHK